MLENFDPETNGGSKDIVADNIAQLKQLFPEVFTEDKIDFTALQAALGEYIETSDERYNFTWHGKAAAKRIAQTPSTGTLRPCKEESKDWNTTQNLFIEGDNLEVLKLLQKAYHKQVKMIYIDPPYNTGKEFIYPDNYQDNLDTYLQYTGQKDSEGRKFGANTETTGRYHTNWLNMMYPRLKLARNLLRDDGVIFISIDDSELQNLRNICNEIFGEENFYASIVWQRRDTPANDAKGFSQTHEYCLVYSKSDQFKRQLLPRDETNLKNYKNPDNDPRGPWTRSALTRPGASAKDVYPITNPQGRECLPPKGSSWRVSKSSLERMLQENRLWWGNDSDGDMPFQKRFLSEVQDGVVPITWWDYKSSGSMRNAKMELRALFDNDPPFDYPKSTKYIKKLINTAVPKEGTDIVLDFFSGSCTTADAVMGLNAEDRGERKFIMVQLPELCDMKSEVFLSGYRTIADIGKERIRRAGEKVKADNEGIENLDIGFKVFKLDSSNIKPWDTDFANLERDLVNNVDNIKYDRSAEDVMYELLLKYGVDLTIPIKTHTIEGKTVYSVGLGALLICLDNDITLDVVEGIGKLKEELQPETVHVVLKDAGLKDDVVKTNAIQLLKRYDINDVKTL